MKFHCRTLFRTAFMVCLALLTHGVSAGAAELNKPSNHAAARPAAQRGVASTKLVKVTPDPAWFNDNQSIPQAVATSSAPNYTGVRLPPFFYLQPTTAKNFESVPVSFSKGEQAANAR